MQSLIISKGDKVLREEKLISIIGDIREVKFVEVSQGKVNISIDAIRELISFINIKPALSDMKIVAVKDANLLSVEAQNALLKILEEPPGYAQIILSCSHESSLLDTVVSRCRLIDLGSRISVDTDSKEFDTAKQNLQKLIKGNLKERLNWLAENKKVMKDRKGVLEMLDMWEVVMRDLMVDHLSKDWADQIKSLQKVRSGIARNNANLSLAIENVVICLPN